MSFSNASGKIELIRYATDINCVISGMFSKLLKQSIISFKFDGNIISFSDNRISSGRLYLNSGFDYITELSAGYCYTDNYNRRFNRQGFMKSKIIKKYNLDITDASLKTEWELMQDLGFDRLWDCGKKKWSIHTSKFT